MGKYVPVQTNCEITGEVVIEINDKTIPGLVLPEMVYNAKKKLGCIFVENHNSESVLLKRRQTVALVLSCLVMQEKQGQVQVECRDSTQSVTGKSNDTDTHIGGPSVGDMEKAGREADSVHSIENRKFYETKEEKQQFIRDCFQLDANAILNAEEKLKEAVIKFF